MRRRSAGPCFAGTLAIGVVVATAAFAGAMDSGAVRPFQVAAPATVDVAVASFSFTPSTAKAALGGTVKWSFNGTSSHTATSRMGLFDSGTAGAGATYSYTFLAAGKYPYQCSIHPSQMSGTVTVPMQVSPATGTTTTLFSVKWAQQLPAGHVADIQIKRPGSTSFVTWMTGATTVRADFMPDGTGVYSFRARLRNDSTGLRSSFSGIKSVTVS